MEPVRRSSLGVPLDWADVDTDQIIPSDWLSGSSAPASARGCSSGVSRRTSVPNQSI